MEDKSFNYKETLDDKISGALKYEKEFGKLTKREFRKKIPIYLIITVVVVPLTFMNFGEGEWLSMTLVSLCIIAAAVVLTYFLNKKFIERNIISVYVTSYQFRTDSASTRKITLKDNGAEFLSPYSKMFLPYGDIETLISDRLNFVVKIKGEERIYVVPKSGQNPQVLFDFDNIFREKLQGRFIYEM